MTDSTPMTPAPGSGIRILLDATAVAAKSGGMETYLRGLLSGWRELLTPDDFLILGRSNLPDISDVLPPRARVEHLGRKNPVGRFLALQWSVPRLAAEFNADVVLTADPNAPRRVPSVALVTTVHDLRVFERPEEFRPLKRWYRRTRWSMGIRAADAIVTNSRSTAAAVKRFFPEVADRLHPAPLGADHALAWAGASARGGHAVAFAHASNKRPEIAIRAWGILAQRREGHGHVLHVLGAGPELRERLAWLVASLGLERLVELHPFVDEDEFVRLFAGASLVVIPSTLEGFGLPVLEAMTLGIPVVATSGVGMEEAGGGHTFEATVDDPESFALQCERALFDQTARRDMIAAGYDHAAGFTWRATAAATREVVAEVVSSAKVGWSA